jgi:Tol biopolymer transport system component/C-terminal processing protease CtpA/Prc
MLRASLLCLLSLPALSQQPGRPYMTQPDMAPDRGELAFVSGGDIWRVNANGGEASLLVSHPAYDSRPLYSPDGSKLAFESTRTGGGDIYVLTLATGTLQRITYQDGPEELDSWSRDGQWLYFHTASGDIAAMTDVYRVHATGGTPMPVAADRYASEFFAAPSPDGRSIALNARGVAARQWWRKGHSHLDVSEIYLVKPGTPPTYERITDGAAKEIWPMWAPDGKSFFFVSDRTGIEQVWRQPLGGTSRQVSSFKDGRVLWPTISQDGKLIVFERDLGIWKMETGNGKATSIPIHLRGTAAGPAVTHLSLTSSFDELAVSPDGKKVAFTAHGEVFAAPAKDGGAALQVTHTPALEAHIQWSPDSRKLAYVSERNGSAQVFLYDFVTESETQITASAQPDAAPRFSPDDKFLAFLRGGRAVMIFDLEKKQERMLAEGTVGRMPLVSRKSLAWSPDSRWVAFSSRGTKGFANILVAPAEGGESKPVSFLANSSARTVEFSPDGKYLLFDTSQRTEETRIARVDLIPRTPRFREDRFRDLFKPAAAGQQDQPDTAKPVAEAKTTQANPVQIVFDGIRQRLSFLPLGVGVDDFEISPDGKSLLVSAESAGQLNLYTYSLDELAAEPPAVRQLTSTAGRKKDGQFSATGKEVYYLDRGRVQTISLDTRQAKPLAVTAEMDVDFDREKRDVFEQAWTYQRDNFFDEKFNGVNWDALRQQYEPFVAAARTPEEVYRLLNLMHGELNASHLGVSKPDGPAKPDIGQLGLRFNASAYETQGRFQIAEVIPLGPAALAGIKAGEYLVSLDGTVLNQQENLWSLLQHKAGKRVELTVSAAAGSQARKVEVQPVTLATEKKLLYRAWVESRRAYVENASSGKLGYVHMPDMSQESLTQLYIDLDAANQARQGVIIDIRNNNGGFVNAYALDVFARRPYLTFLERGRAAIPARSALGQRALELPTILVTNQHSLSDAEDFSEGYRRLKLGKVVGEPTAGWIVYTWNQPLIDGSQLRMPRIKVFDNDGVLMEMHPRPVDVPVERPVGESYSGKDIQLDTAVRELLAQIEAESGHPAAAPTAENGRP